MQKIIKESEYFIAWLVFWICFFVSRLIVRALGPITLFKILDKTIVNSVIFMWIYYAGTLVLIALPSYILFRIFVAKLIINKIQKRFTLTPKQIQDTPQPLDSQQDSDSAEQIK